MTMTPEQWKQIRYFSPEEGFGKPYRMDFNLLYNLDRLREYLRRPIFIHRGYEKRDGKGYHPLGMAVDCHAEGLNSIEFYVAAVRFRFGGIGIYPWWKNPGLHLDTRPVPRGDHKTIWGSVAEKIYVPFDADFLNYAFQGVKIA